MTVTVARGLMAGHGAGAEAGDGAKRRSVPVASAAGESRYGYRDSCEFRPYLVIDQQGRGRIVIGTVSREADARVWLSTMWLDSVLLILTLTVALIGATTNATDTVAGKIVVSALLVI
jgi:hypothetical protein